jgi:cellulose synthase/poly-beta-1,6-N-acetylglucosamine synthase-like glycosyltransferase
MSQESCLLLLKGTAIYFLTINFVYACLTFLSWMKIKYFRKKIKEDTKIKEFPGVSFLVPAYNEESLIIETIQTYLSLSLEKKEIIVIDDGSQDKTMSLLKTLYQLRKSEDPTGRLYQSITHPMLKVLEAPHMGKAHALNFGIRFTKFDLICTLDADTIPVVQGVEACLRSFATNPKLIAAGGVIKILSSQNLKENSPLADSAKERITSFQRIEYLRAFVCERLGWSFLDSTLLMSGAFCMLKKEAINKIGGFCHRSITEDFDLIVRLRRAYPIEAHFKILPITTCYTQAPNKIKHLSKQRMRWQMGLVQTLFRHGNLFLHPGHGLLGLLAFPYFCLVEALSPVVELISYIAVPFALFNGWIEPGVVIIYLGLGILFNLLITVIGIHFDINYVSQNNSWPITRSVVDTILFHFGYKQLNSWWRIQGMIKIFLKNPSWGEKPRQEITHYF